MLKTNAKKVFISILLLVLIFGINTKSIFAQTSSSVLYVPLIGITSVPNPLALPNGTGNVIYHYAVKNFLKEVGLTNVQVVDDKCSPVKFVTGDDNGNSKLDYSETWRYTCTNKLAKTTQSTATATGTANNITATHKAYATVIVGSNNPPPLISIINITKVAYPLYLPTQGGEITYSYKVTNPGVVPLSKVVVTDDKCSAMSGKLGDTNGNDLLDINEVWIYSCTMPLSQTTTDTVSVTAFANGLEAKDSTMLTITVDTPTESPPPLFDLTTSPQAIASNNLRAAVWGVLSGVLLALILLFVLTKKTKLINQKKLKLFMRR